MEALEATTRPAAGAGRPPRPRAPKPSHAAWSTTYSPYAAPVRASPRAAKLAQPESVPHTLRPRRPLSASQVASTTSSRMAQTSPRPDSARPVRPTSASQARYMQLETIAFPMQSFLQPTSATCHACNSEITIQQETDSAAMQLKLQALLEMWGDEQLNFRSSALFYESTFQQAKALASRMPRPNAFISAVAFACLTQLGSVLNEQYPVLPNVIQELGTAIYSNFTDLQHQVELEHQRQHQAAIVFEHGKPWFLELKAQQTRCESLQTSVITSKNEVELLKEMLQEARSVKPPVVSTAALQSPSKRHQLDEYYIPPVLQLGDLSLESLSEEVLTAFTKISDADARHLLALILENAVERDLAKFPDVLAATVGNMQGQDRRRFLRECFDYVTPSELQDALHERDEVNDEKRYQALVEDLHNVLHLQENGSKNDSSVAVAFFHSEEARIGKRVHELMELVEDVATELSFFESKDQTRFPLPLVERLRQYQSPEKRMRKEHELIQRQQPLVNDTDYSQCECICGRHRLIEADGAVKNAHVIIEEPLENENEAVKMRKPRRKSTLKRPLSGRRKNAISFSPRFGSPRRSSASIHVFPLAEVCHLVSSILHLQFSRDVAEPCRVLNTPVSALMVDNRFDFLKPDATAARSFKTLAKDYLVRKYGIKSIAVMHTMQLERSLLHYAAKENHTRCQLFSWFFGADKTRAQSKDAAFAFFQKLVKCILNLYAVKKIPRANSITNSPSPTRPQPQQLTYSALITLWTECIGDGEAANSRSITAMMALETCKRAFPPAMQRSSHLTMFREKLHRQNLDQTTVEIEEFLHGAMKTWQLMYDIHVQEAMTTIETTGVLDPDGFARCLIANGLEFTTGERYELFDLLTQESDENVIPSKKMVQLIVEAKNWRPAMSSSTLITG